MTKRKFILSVYSEISFGLHSSHKLRMVASFYQEMMDIPMGSAKHVWLQKKLFG